MKTCTIIAAGGNGDIMSSIEEQLKEIQGSLYLSMLKDVFGKDAVELGQSVFETVQL